MWELGEGLCAEMEHRTVGRAEPTSLVRAGARALLCRGI